MKTKLTAKRLREVLSYDRHTGLFTRKTKFVSRVAGSWHEAGYAHGMVRVKIGVDGQRYPAHRLAWLYVYGHWPRSVIDHIDGDPSNNAIANLRDVSPLANQQNRHRPNSNNVSGLIGVAKQSNKCRRPWMARIMVSGKQIYLGTFLTPDEAHKAYLDAKRTMHDWVPQ